MNRREAYVALNMMQGVGPVGVRALISALGSPEAIFGADKATLISAAGGSRDLAKQVLEQRDVVDPCAEIERASKAGVRLLTQEDEEYPRRLLEIHDPPLALYAWGGLEEEKDKHAVAVVGSRRTTHYGMEIAERLSFQLAQAGFTVVSGLARGIDTAAHRGALKAAGRTVAVLGGAIDRMYPPENADLARAIAAQGVVLSEFSFGREPDKTTFPIRNRIVSGLSRGIVVVEAGLNSGALITANQALEQGRSVFAVPGRIDSPASKGCHQLIKSGARLVEGVDDILEELSFLMPTRRDPVAAEHGAPEESGPKPAVSGDEEAVLSALRGEERLDVDALTRLAGLRPSVVSAVLIGLEMKRMVRMLPGRIVELTR